MYGWGHYLAKNSSWNIKKVFVYKFLNSVTWIIKKFNDFKQNPTNLQMNSLKRVGGSINQRNQYR